MRCAILAVSLLAGCGATQQPSIRTVEVQIQVPTKCISALPARPVLLTLDQVLALADGPAVVTLAAQHEQLWAYSAELEAIASPCVLK